MQLSQVKETFMKLSAGNLSQDVYDKKISYFKMNKQLQFLQNLPTKRIKFNHVVKTFRIYIWTPTFIVWVSNIKTKCSIVTKFQRLAFQTKNKMPLKLHHSLRPNIAEKYSLIISNTLKLSRWFSNMNHRLTSFAYKLDRFL